VADLLDDVFVELLLDFVVVGWLLLVFGSVSDLVLVTVEVFLVVSTLGVVLLAIKH
jgi:hypothetical protein